MESEYAEKTERQSAVEQIKITEVISLTLKRWPWILLSLTVCIGLALDRKSTRLNSSHWS